MRLAQTRGKSRHAITPPGRFKVKADARLAPSPRSQTRSRVRRYFQSSHSYLAQGLPGAKFKRVKALIAERRCGTCTKELAFAPMSGAGRLRLHCRDRRKFGRRPRADCRKAGMVGASSDPAANVAHALRISRPDGRVAVLVVPTDEEQMIARHTVTLLGGSRHRECQARSKA